MPDSIIHWIALFGLVGIALLFIVELFRWRSIGSIISRKQRILRFCLIILLELILGMVFVSSWVTNRGNPFTDLLYWTICIFIGLIVIALAIIDMREVVKNYAALNREMFSSLRGDERRDN